MKKEEPLEYESLLRPQQVADMFSVGEKCVTRWAKEGKFPEGTVVWTLGGHRRFKESLVRQLLEDCTQ